MSGIAILLDLLKKNPSLASQTLHSYGLFSATVAASAAVASVAAGRPLASRILFGYVDFSVGMLQHGVVISDFHRIGGMGLIENWNSVDGGISVAFCDAAPVWTEDLGTNLHSVSENIIQHDSLKYSIKQYPIELKPLFSAFGLRALAMTSLRSFLLHYLPLLEHRIRPEDDEDFLQDDQEEGEPVNLVVPLKKSMKQIVRETTVVTTRRLLERLAVHYVSQRMAWKLLKDVPKSAQRKAARGMPTYLLFYGTSKSTFRGHLLAVAASWVVQVAIELYHCFSNEDETEEEVDKAEKVRILQRKVTGATIRCSASLFFASIGAGVGAILFRPSTGQWIGCAIGDFAGPSIVGICFDKFLHQELC
ncbi:hypothetical protein ACLOJK_000032 [Asimina triloba]